MTQASEIAAVILAAGRSTRMGAENKLLLPLNDRPLVRIAAETALASPVSRVVVVTGHERARVEAALEGLDVVFAYNADYADGLSASLRTGLDTLPAETRGALILLGDMPFVGADLIGDLIAAFPRAGDDAVVVPSIGGQRGNPVLWGRGHFEALKQVSGDKGGREILKKLGERVIEVAVPESRAFVDIDTAEEFAAARHSSREG